MIILKVAFACNTSGHACTNYTPYYLTHGQEAHVSVDLLDASTPCALELAFLSC